MQSRDSISDGRQTSLVDLGISVSAGLVRRPRRQDSSGGLEHLDCRMSIGTERAPSQFAPFEVGHCDPRFTVNARLGRYSFVS